MVARVLVCSTFQVSVSVRTRPTRERNTRRNVFGGPGSRCPSPLACLNHMSEEASCCTRSAEILAGEGLRNPDWMTNPSPLTEHR